MAVQIDFIPTLLGRLGLSYESSFFGVDVMRVPKERGRIVVAHNFSVVFARPGHAVVLQPNGEVKVYGFEKSRAELVAETPDPETDRTAHTLTQPVQVGLGVGKVPGFCSIIDGSARSWRRRCQAFANGRP